MNMNITYNEICSFLGEPLKSSGGHSFWQCPICMDRGKDNLVYTHSKELLTCFADNSHSHEIYKRIAQSGNKEFYYKPVKRPVQKKTPLEIDLEYITKCEIELSKDEQSKTFLKKHRGLYGETLGLGIGIDKQNKRWVFPAIGFDFKLIGAEYRTSYFIMTKDKRPKDCQRGLFKAKGTVADLCLINQASSKDKSLIIIEGFIDGYTLWQYLKEQGQENDYEIATPTNGVGTIPNLLHKIPIENYKDIIFWLDNDKAGNDALTQIKEKAEFNYSINKPPCQCCKDFNQWYLKHERGKNEYIG